MRAPIPFLIASLVIAAGCAMPAGGVYQSGPSPMEEAWEEPPVEVTIVRADDRRLQVSTNRPAYVAVFEILPGRGVSLVYPRSSGSQVEVTGTRWLNADWRDPRSDSRMVLSGRRRATERHIYVLASERPLRITSSSFDQARLRGVVGADAWNDDEPYRAIEKLSWHFVPASLDEDWGEDLYTMDLDRRDTYNRRVARVYCPDGSVVYVRDDHMDRAYCPSRGRQGGRAVSGSFRPDSVVASSGRPFSVPAKPKKKFPASRIPVTPAGEERGNGGRTTVGDKADRRDDDRDKKGDNGNHFGRERNDGDPSNPGNSGPDKTKPETGRGSARPQGRPASPIGASGIREMPVEQPVLKPEREAEPQRARAEPKSEKPEKAEKPEPKPEREEKPEKESKPESKPEPKPKPDGDEEKEKGKGKSKP